MEKEKGMNEQEEYKHFVGRCNSCWTQYDLFLPCYSAVTSCPNCNENINPDEAS